MSVLCTICARGGSKGVKNKNLRPLLGKPLIAHSILQAKAAKCCDFVAVSSDSSEILRAAAEFGADMTIMRPEELATDTAPKIPVIRHCTEAVEEKTGARFETVLDLDATSPLRNPSDILAALELFRRTGAPNVVTGASARRSPWFNLLELLPDGTVALVREGSEKIIRRQDAPQCFDMNASIYVYRRSTLFECASVILPGTRIYVMPPERSLDIDSELDFELVAYLAERRGSLL